MRRALTSAVLLAALLAIGCEDQRLHGLASTRLAQLEATDTLSHDGFETLPAPEASWRGEVIAMSSEPFTATSAVEEWMASPPHRSILEHRRTHYGFATSSQPTRSGRYYAVMIVEEQ